MLQIIVFHSISQYESGGCMMLGLIKCRICDEDIAVYDAEKVIIHYSTCATCKLKGEQKNSFSADLTFHPDWKKS